MTRTAASPSAPEPHIAIVAVAYNRVPSLSRLLSSLLAADYGGREVTLVISVDRSDTDEVERFADAFVWPFGPKRVKKHAENFGLRRHMLSQGVEELDEFDAIVVLEDDIIVSPAFYSYVCQTVARYADVSDVAGISLYSFPLSYLTYRPFEPVKDASDVHFIQMAQSWGEVWMRRSWREFYAWYLDHLDFTPSPDVPAPMMGWTRSWLKYHTRFCIETGRWFVYPYHALSSNCGDAGTHTGRAGAYNIFQTALAAAVPDPMRLPASPADGVRYDAFLESVDVALCLGVDPSDVCVDLAGFRGPHPARRYWLTSSRAPYGVVRSYGLQRHPVEANVIGGVAGDELVLYDTRVDAPAAGDSRAAARRMTAYSFRIRDFVAFVRGYGLKPLAGQFAARIIGRLTRL